jgi:hypothetical protein
MDRRGLQENPQLYKKCGKFRTLSPETLEKELAVFE